MGALPYLTADLPGTGGALRTRDEDFEVDELPAYPAAGHGDHLFVRIEKRGLGTLEAIRRLARATGVAEHDVGFAGMKDRRAVTRQWVSLPPGASADGLAALAASEDPALRVVEHARHPHKLRTGHLAGNRFRLALRELPGGAAAAEARARAILDRLGAPPGAPNWYGEQRFGKDGANARIGRELLGDPTGRRGPRGRERRLYVSALQSELFNELVRRRMADGLFARVLEGDVLCKTDSGAPFACTDPAADQPRLERGEVAITGAMFGHQLRQPTPGTEAARREAAVLADAGLTLDSFRAVGKLANGARRPLAVRPAAIEVTADGERLVVAFALPAGAYATAIIREVLKLDAPDAAAGSPPSPVPPHGEP